MSTPWTIDFPLLLKEFDIEKNSPTTLSDFSRSSAKKVWWVCQECSNEWYANIANRTGPIKAGCPQCGRRRTTEASRTRGRLSYNKKPAPGGDLATKAPHIASEWHPTKNGHLTPETVPAQSNKQAFWLGKDCGHEWSARVQNRVVRKSGCPVCSGLQVVAGFNDLASLFPEVALEWHPTKNSALRGPSEITASNNKPAWWVCAEGHEWRTQPSHRVRGSGCPYCSGNRVIVGVTDIATMRPDILHELHPTKNDVGIENAIKLGTAKKVWWVCSEGHEWLSSPSNRFSSGRQRGCPKCISKVSKPEVELATWIKSLGFTIETSKRGLTSRFELDIYIPEKRIAVEFNGLYWHSEARNPNKNHHKDKLQACQDVGVELIQIWEDDWALRRSVVERLLKSRLGVSDELRVYARKTTARNISLFEARSFLNAHHILGFGSGSRYLGLVSASGALVAVMSLKKIGADGQWLLNRYATSAHVIGGHSKLLKFFSDTETDWKRITTFADLTLSVGSMYEKTGWKKDAVLRPDYTYKSRDRRVHKFNFRIKNFKNNPDLKFEDGMSERELAQLNGLHRIWDAGKIRYTYDNPHPRG